MNVEEVRSELIAIKEMPSGVLHNNCIETLIRKIEVSGPSECLPGAYIELIRSYFLSSEAYKAFQAYIITLRLLDNRPELWKTDDRSQLFWYFKWVAYESSKWPQISKQQALAVLDDMNDRFMLEGAGMSAVEYCRFYYARDIGDPLSAKFFRHWLATPRDEYSDSNACSKGAIADFFWQYGRLEELVALEPQLHGASNVEPANGLSFVALGQLLTGQAEGANKSLRKSMRNLFIEWVMDCSALRGRHLQALMLGHRVGEGLQLLRVRDFALLEGVENPLSRLQFLISLVSGLNANRMRPDFLTGIDRWPTVASLLDFVDVEATDLASQFDARNENTYYTDAVEKARAARLAPKRLPDPS